MAPTTMAPTTTPVPSRKLRITSALAGGWVADAASLGLHWLYDSARIREVAGETPEFLPPKADYYEGGFGYFAHSGKQAGDVSHYGAATRVLSDSLVANEGRLIVRDYQRRFRDYFGPGGGWQGYIDNPTRVTLNHLHANEQAAISEAQAEIPGVSAEQQRRLVQKVLPYTRRLSGDSLREPVRRAIALTYPEPEIQEAGIFMAETIDRRLVPQSGADDMQLPAVSKLAPLIACYSGHPDLMSLAETAVRVTNHNEEAVAWAQCVTVLLNNLFQGKPLAQALDLAQRQAPDQTSLQTARDMPQLDPEAAAEAFGRTCYLKEAIPVVFHILTHARSFTEAVRANIFCGGDSCGRAWVIGPAMAALYGVGGEQGLPLSWLARLREPYTLMEDLETLEALGARAS